MEFAVIYGENMRMLRKRYEHMSFLKSLHNIFLTYFQSLIICMKVPNLGS